MHTILVPNIVEANGKTIRENNLEIGHKIPLGTLVEVDAEEINEHGIRAFVAEHQRDCDGEPLYGLSLDPDFENLAWIKENMHPAYYKGKISGAFGEDCLIVIRKPKAA